jgi:uncharacterized membrane-anchored protein
MRSREIVRRVENPFVLDGQTEAQTATELRALIPAILDRAFKGEL